MIVKVRCLRYYHTYLPRYASSLRGVQTTTEHTARIAQKILETSNFGEISDHWLAQKTTQCPLLWRKNQTWMRTNKRKE